MIRSKVTALFFGLMAFAFAFLAGCQPAVETRAEPVEPPPADVEPAPTVAQAPAATLTPIPPEPLAPTQIPAVLLYEKPQLVMFWSAY